METNGPFWEERLLRPIDIYPEYRRGGRTEGGEQVDDKHLRLVQYFLNIETDEGIVGRAGPVGADAARLVLTHLAPIIVSKDPRAIELLWDQMHRLQVHGRQGDAMIATRPGRKSSRRCDLPPPPEQPRATGQISHGQARAVKISLALKRLKERGWRPRLDGAGFFGSQIISHSKLL